VTLLAPLKHITTLKLPKFPFLAGSTLEIEDSAPSLPTSVPDLSPPEPIEVAPTPSDLLEQIGAKLRLAREQKQLSIEAISALTQIQPRLVQAIEEGHIEMLPEQVYVKGMIKRYANSVGLNGSELAQQVPTWAPEAATFEPSTKLQVTGLTYTRRIHPVYAYFVYILAVITIGAAVSHLLSNFAKPQYVATETAKPLQQPKIAAVAPPAIVLPDVKVKIEVGSSAWAQIGIDGQNKVTGTLSPGTKFDWTAKKQITINTNNAGGLIISHGTQPAKPLGKIGQKQSVTIKVSN
jgi:transcriptional regulator with XRE-family HTH domain